mmetsp:Transcript_40725/g.59941  ORF Transcript_40725/g.59941 Transcript_40725/m.59941 type:complete len:91 (-) Transcript_40725:216-488(-)
MDFVCGNASYLIPLLGESFDLVWAPMQAVMMGAMFDKQLPNAKYVGLIEEILPGTDIIPSATLSWMKVHPQYFEGFLQIAKSAKKTKKEQ